MNMRMLAAALCACAVLPVQAQDLRWVNGDFDIGFTGEVVVGAAIRTQDRNQQLLGKLNVPGQQSLCAADDCMSLRGDPAPNQRLVDAQGSYSGGNTDNGDLNYDKYDLINAATRFTPTLTAHYGDWTAKLRGILYYDPVNASFDESHPNTLYQPASTPRSKGIERTLGRDGELREAFVSTLVTLGGKEFTVIAGNQRITWGESILTPLNTLNTLDAPDAIMAHMPGFELKELYLPTTAISVAGELGGGFSGEAFYQLLWHGARPEPSGSFFSTNDFVGGGKYLTLALGQYAEDPDRQFHPAGLTALISDSSRTLRVQPDRDPSNAGQFGLQLKYFAENILGGTEFAGYYANYHSRLPYISTVSADASCTRKAPSGNFALAFVSCLGFNSRINPVGLEPVAVDTVQPFLEYPEDIHLIGASFSTNIGSWSLAGEYSYRPNMPLQVHATDVLFASLAPGLPEEDIPVPANTGLLGIDAPFTIPGHRHGAPDFLSRYRGLSEYGPDTVVHGYERFQVGQFALTGIRIFGSSANPFGADQIQVLAEVSGTQIFDLPDLSQLQLEGTGNRSHYSPGADGTGSGGVADSGRLNPTQQKTGAATAFSWGYRLAIRSQYSQAIGNVSLYPTILFFHDLGGISPVTIDNYVKGRKNISLQMEAAFTQALCAGAQYQWFTGAGRNNLRSDRDNLGAYLRYSF